MFFVNAYQKQTVKMVCWREEKRELNARNNRYGDGVKIHFASTVMMKKKKETLLK